MLPRVLHCWCGEGLRYGRETSGSSSEDAGLLCIDRLLRFGREARAYCEEAGLLRDGLGSGSNDCQQGSELLRVVQ